ncbi:MAG: hypothetical protein ACTSSJ_03065 [Candidatus Odinarchaeia archaeon]
MSRMSRLIRRFKSWLKAPKFKSIHAPPRMFWYALSLIIVYFVLAGGIYDLVNQPIVMGSDPNTGNPVLIFTVGLGGGIDEQFVLEGFVASILMFLGFLGMILIYESTKHFYNPSYSTMLLVAGIAMIIVAFVGCEMLISIKITS